MKFINPSIKNALSVFEKAAAELQAVQEKAAAAIEKRDQKIADLEAAQAVDASKVARASKLQAKITEFLD